MHAHIDPPPSVVSVQFSGDALSIVWFVDEEESKRTDGYVAPTLAVATIRACACAHELHTVGPFLLKRGRDKDRDRERDRGTETETQERQRHRRGRENDRWIGIGIGGDTERKGAGKATHTHTAHVYTHTHTAHVYTHTQVEAETDSLYATACAVARSVMTLLCLADLKPLPCPQPSLPSMHPPPFHHHRSWTSTWRSKPQTRSLLSASACTWALAPVASRPCTWVASSRCVGGGTAPLALVDVMMSLCSGDDGAAGQEELHRGDFH